MEFSLIYITVHHHFEYARWIDPSTRGHGVIRLQSRIERLTNSRSIFANPIAPTALRMTHPTQDTPNRIGQFESRINIGSSSTSGEIRYDRKTETYTLGSARNGDRQSNSGFPFAYLEIEGDFIVTARMRFNSEVPNSLDRIGWMARSSLDENAIHVNGYLQANGVSAIEYRSPVSTRSEEIQPRSEPPGIIQLQRRGNRFILSVANFGDEFSEIRFDALDLPETLYVGIFSRSIDMDTKRSATFENVRIVTPVWDGFEYNEDFLGSHLEILDIESGAREIVHSASGCIEAPNWTPDGRTLIFNSQGRLHNFDIETKRISALDTDFANRNNNDHVLSFDGKRIAISHHSADHNGESIIYTLPIEGGKPTRITDKGPSYLHGWSPDGNYLAYTAERAGQYDIYIIPSSGGEEIRLTNTPGLDDGPEYTPDGKYIYFNSERSGRMQIWRMKADGSDPERMTHDERNNWFAHISPDGEEFVYLSYGQDIDPSAHPFYKHVYLCRMPIDGGESRVIAYLYGGQGTINVPSWSPEGKRIAFVSNSGRI